MYGYNGQFDLGDENANNNLFWTLNGEIVYYVAGVCVVMNIADKRQRFFTSHSDNVVSLALHKKYTRASGAAAAWQPSRAAVRHPKHGDRLDDAAYCSDRGTGVFATSATFSYSLTLSRLTRRKTSDAALWQPAGS